jgi:hypothetical protein
MKKEVLAYLSAIGKKGGKAGRGKAKARPSAVARAAVNARWKKHRRNTVIYTSYFSSKKIMPEYVAIRISVGHPRWKLPYQVAGAIPGLAPDRAWIGIERAEYDPLYRAKLDAAGVEKIRAEIRALTDERPAVLLCFESLMDGAWCHRRIFADWWQEKTGEIVAEL